MGISGFIRRPRRYEEYLFDDLPPDVRHRAEGLLAAFCRRHRHRLASARWLYPVLVGQARRLAVNPPTSEWGRSMLSKRGGYAVQESYRRQGRTGGKHPAHKAARISANHRRCRKMEHGEERMRQAVGLPPKSRSKVLPFT
jgi:hypothetical protein